MDSSINQLIEKLDERQLKPNINLERPIFVQPEDSIKYRASRIVLICGMLNTAHGLSKEIISCVDFLLRNSGYQKKFIIEYFRNQRNLIKKIDQYTPQDTIEIDFNIIQYKSVPWDLRFNDMLFYLYVRKTVRFEGEKYNLRIFLTDSGIHYFNKIKEIFIDGVNFLEIFGKRLDEEKTKKIITQVIPSAYWRENEKLNY